MAKLATNDYLTNASTFHSLHAISKQLAPVASGGMAVVDAPTFSLHCLESPTGADGGAVEGAAATGLPASALALSLHSASTDDDRDDTREGGLELPLGTGLASSQLSLHSSVAVAVAAGAAGAGALPRVLGASGVEEPPRDS